MGIIALHKVLEQEVKDRTADVARLRTELLTAIDVVKKEKKESQQAEIKPGMVPNGNSQIAQLDRTQNAMQIPDQTLNSTIGSRDTWDSARKSLESTIDALVLFKERTEPRLSKIESALEAAKTTWIGRPANDAANTFTGSTYGKVDASLRELKASIAKINEKLKLQHVQMGLFSLRAFDIAPEERPHCIEELVRRESALREGEKSVAKADAAEGPSTIAGGENRYT